MSLVPLGNISIMNGWGYSETFEPPSGRSPFRPKFCWNCWLPSPRRRSQDSTLTLNGGNACLSRSAGIQCECGPQRQTREIGVKAFCCAPRARVFQRRGSGPGLPGDVLASVLIRIRRAVDLISWLALVDDCAAGHVGDSPLAIADHLP